jgi:hypothetical protein
MAVPVRAPELRNLAGDDALSNAFRDRQEIAGFGDTRIQGRKL